MKLAVCLAFLLSALPAAAAGDGPGLLPEGVRFQIGDDPARAAPDFDDSAWVRPEIPGSWQSHGLGNVGQTGWYRMEFHVPAGWNDRELAFSPGIVGNVYEVYWNGRLIGRKGGFEPLVDLPRTNAFHVFPIDPPILTDRPNIVAIRVHCYWSAGGIVAEKPRVAPLNELLAHKAAIEKWPAIGLASTLSVLTLILALAIGIAIWQRQQALAWAYAAVIFSHFIWECARCAVLLTGSDWLTMELTLAVAMFYGLNPLAGLIAVICLFDVPFTRKFAAYLATSAIVILGCIFASPWPGLAPVAGLVGLLWMISILIVVASIVVIAIRRRRRLAIPFAVLLAVAGGFFLLEQLEFFHPVLLNAVAWVDFSTWFFVLFSVVFGAIVVTRLVDYKFRADRLASGILTAEIQERARLARELHDGVAQTLLAIKLNVETQRGAGDLDVQQLLTQLDEASDEVRDAAHDLHPAVLGSRSLEDAFRVHARSLGSEHVEFEIESSAGPEPQAEVRHHLFRIFQELLGNAIKHGADRSARVRWLQVGSAFVLEVENRVSAETGSAPGLGERSLRERVELLGARLTTRMAGDRFLARVEIPKSLA